MDRRFAHLAQKFQRDFEEGASEVALKFATAPSNSRRGVELAKAVRNSGEKVLPEFVDAYRDAIGRWPLGKGWFRQHTANRFREMQEAVVKLHSEKIAVGTKAFGDGAGVVEAFQRCSAEELWPRLESELTQRLDGWGQPPKTFWERYGPALKWAGGRLLAFIGAWTVFQSLWAALRHAVGG